MEDAPSAPPRARAVPLVAVAVALLAAVLVLAGTRGGIDLPPDGVTYVAVAGNLADGRGPTSPFVAVIDPFTPRQALAFEGEVPVLGWPPLYPVALAPAVALGIEAPAAARALGAASAAALAATTALATARLVGARRRAAPWAAGGAAALVAVQPWYARLQAVVASEPLYLALALASLAVAARALARWRDDDAPGAPWYRVPPDLAVAFALASLALGVRYVGASLVVALATAVVVVGPGPARRRVAPAAALGGLALAPALVWSRWVEAAAGTPVRRLAWHPPGGDELAGVVSAVTGWVVPATAGTPGRVLAVVLALGAVAAAVRGWRWALAGGRAPGVAVPWLVLVGLSSGAYLVVLVATHSLADRMVPLNGRLLLPLVAPLVITTVAGVVWSVRRRPALPAGRRVLVGAAGLVATAGIVAGQAGAWRDLVADGRGFAVDPTTTAAADHLRALHAPVLAANDPALVWRITGARVLVVPRAVDDASGSANPEVADDLRELGQVLAEEGGVAVVHPGAAFANPGLVGVDRLVDEAGLEVVAEVDGMVVLAPRGAQDGRALP